MLVFDIDETMVHTLDEDDPQQMKSKITLMIPDSADVRKMVPVYINVRPHLMQCLFELKQRFQIVAFTASE